MKQYIFSVLVASFIVIGTFGIGATVMYSASEEAGDSETYIDTNEETVIETERCEFDGEIRVFKFHDVEETGTYEPEDGDMPLADWHFTLRQQTPPQTGPGGGGATWHEIGEGYTQSDGYLIFSEEYENMELVCSEGWPQGHFKFEVSETVEDGWYFTGGEVVEGSSHDGSFFETAISFQVDVSESVEIHFGNSRDGDFFEDCYDITVFSYYDVVGDGEYDPGAGDYGLDGWHIELYMKVDGEWSWQAEDWTNTDGYVFFDCMPIDENFQVRQYLPEGWYNTEARAFPTPQGTLLDYDIDVANGMYVDVSFYLNTPRTARFGNRELEEEYGNITIYKFYDSSYDGDHTGEELIDGFKFQLWTATGEGEADEKIGDPVETTDGTYTFEDLEEGYYIVEELDGYFGEDDDCCWFPTTEIFQFVSVESGEEYNLYFGNVHGGNITGMKFLSIDGDEEFQVGWDKPLAGWDIHLYEAIEVEPDLRAEIIPEEPWFEQGERLDTETTNSLGEYKFECIPPGYYFVKEEMYEGWYNVSPQKQLVHVYPCETTEDVDFANCMYKDIYGIKFYDMSMSGTFEPEAGDYLIEGWEIRLLDDEGDVLQTTHTLANGYYFFDGLTVGTYYVEEAVPEGYDPEGWVRTTPEEHPVRVELNCCSPKTIINFGNYERPEITIRKFYDANMSGEFEEGDHILWEDMFAFNVEKDGIFYDAFEVFGEWNFYVDAESNYSVEEILPAGWYPTTDLIQYTDEPLGPGENWLVEFGNVRLGHIEVFKFHDLNVTGEYDDGDYGLGGWRFNLWNTTMDNGSPIPDEEIATNTTDEDGYAMFYELEPGWYMVEEIGKVGWEATTEVFVFVEVPLEETITVKFGNVELGEITVFKYHDCDVTGEYTEDLNAPLGRWNITLHNEANELVGYGYTDGNGEITFEGLLPGEYYVDEHLWDCWMNTTELPVSVTLGAGGEERVEIGNAQYGWISGYKYCGYEGYVGEPIPGWEIYLYVDDERIETISTDDYGYYEFTCLEPGTYTVREEVPEDWYNYSPDNVTVYVGLEDHHEIDFYNYRHADIWGLKFCDFNMNEEFEIGIDAPLCGWTIELYQVMDGETELYRTTTTDNHGIYYFDDVAPGHYLVSEVIKECGWVNTTAYEVPVHVTGCIEDIRVDFGNYKPSDITVFIYDSEMEEPVEGVYLELWEADEFGVRIGDGPMKTGTTGYHGYYVFCQLDPGYYIVEIADGYYYEFVMLRCCSEWVEFEYNGYTETGNEDPVGATYAKFE